MTDYFGSFGTQVAVGVTFSGFKTVFESFSQTISFDRRFAGNLNNLVLTTDAKTSLVFTPDTPATLTL